MYIDAADLRIPTRKPWAAGITLSDSEASKEDLDVIIPLVTSRIESDLNDDFEPPNPDVDEIIDVNATGGWRLYLPRRVRSITTLKTRNSSGTLITEPTTAWRLRKSLNAAGTDQVDGAMLDWIEALPGLSTGWWPYGTATVQLTGKFGWAAVPDEIKRLAALLVYDIVKARLDPLTTIVQRTTIDSVITYGPSSEITDIMRRYKREPVMVA